LDGSTRIVANTLASYGRLFAFALVGLLGTPIALRLMGAADYGIFSVIAGSLALLTIINGALTSSAQRHIAFALGAGDTSKVRIWFVSSLYVHLALTAITTGIALMASHWVLFRLLTIPPDRVGMSIWIYRMVVFAMACNIISTPYQAFLLAHEEIVSLSLFNIVGAVCLLAGTFSLHLFSSEFLLWYAGIYSLSQVIIFVSPMGYCWWRYSECRNLSKIGLNWKHLGDFLLFSWWNLFGAFAWVVRAQGPAIMLNAFMGPVANAAYGIALQGNSFATNISFGVLRATTPAIVKRWSAGNHHGVSVLSNLSNLYAFGALWIATAPILFEMDFCLKLWLHIPPPDTAVFLTLLLITVLVDQLTSGFIAPLQATGRIAAYQLLVGGATCAALPVGYVLLAKGLSGTSILWAGVGASVLAGAGRLFFARTRAQISAKGWCNTVCLPALGCVSGSSLVVLLCHSLLGKGQLRMAIVLAANALVTLAIIWFFGTTAGHREKLKGIGGLVWQRTPLSRFFGATA
jgi:O-antigen/teichoic acid export membrane protein